MNDLETLYRRLSELQHKIDVRTQTVLQTLPETQNPKVMMSRSNLLDYLHLREEDLSDLQPSLMQAGLASLSRVESGVMSSLQSMLQILEKAQPENTPASESQSDFPRPDPQQSAELLEERARTLFGRAPENRKVSIMVTLPSEAAWSDELVTLLLQQGMNLARINTAHDNPKLWQEMVERVRRLALDLNKPCRIMVDLCGPKLRTGPLERESAALHLKVQRNLLGLTHEPAKILLYSDQHGKPGALSDVKDYQPLPVPYAVLRSFKSGDKLLFTDSRGKAREIVLVENHGPFQWKALCFKPAYLMPGTEVDWVRREKKKRYKLIKRFMLPEWMGREVDIRLFCGDYLLLSHGEEAGGWTQIELNGQWQQIAKISCQTPEALQNLALGDPVWIDDGKLGAQIVGMRSDGVLLKIIESGLGGVRLKEDKGLNFPRSELDLRGLSREDREYLDWISQEADLVGLSFVQSPQDIDELIDELHSRGRTDLPILAKIETAKGVHQLPQILLHTLGRHDLGVMIARGDLAVELGAVRMAELQDEILWLCEAAHTPVIWATQVLETLAKKGVTSRPELTDAAMSVRSECVMLNKGPYIADALRVLSNILNRMQEHTSKKVSVLKPLKWDKL